MSTLTHNPPVTVSYLKVAQRWEIATVHAAGTTALTEHSGGVWTGKGPSGQIVEIVIDAPVIPAAGRDLIARAFGPSVAEVVEQLTPESDLDLVIERQLPATTESHSDALSLPGEPGVPTKVTDLPTELGRYAITGTELSAFISPSHDEPQGQDPIWLTLRNGTLRVQLPDSVRGHGLWVRISSAQSGSLLALAAVREGSPPAAEVTMNLEVQPEDLHVAITPTPLTPIGDRTDRLRQWAEELLATRCGRNAETAARIAEQVGDCDLLARAQQLMADVRAETEDADRTVRADRAVRSTSRVQRPRRSWEIGVMLCVVAVALISFGYWAARNSGGVQLTGDGQPGPVIATYADGAIVRAFILDTLPEALPGNVLPLIVSARTIELIGYSFDPATTPEGQEEQAARQACRSTLNRPGFDNGGIRVAQRPITIRLHGQDDSGNSLGSVIAASSTLSEDVVRFSSMIEACNTAAFQPEGHYFLVPSTVERGMTSVLVRLPATLPAGLWTLSIDAPERPVSVTGEILIRVRTR
jgi:hypothetical protein